MIMKFYEEPQEHHWVIARQLRAYYRSGGPYNEDHARTVMWMIRKVGARQFNEMLDALRNEAKRETSTRRG